MAAYDVRIKIRSAYFSTVINDIFAGLLGKTVFSYLDDIVASNDPDTHLNTLKTVFQKFQDACLKVKTH